MLLAGSAAPELRVPIATAGLRRMIQIAPRHPIMFLTIETSEQIICTVVAAPCMAMDLFPNCVNLSMLLYLNRKFGYFISVYCAINETPM